MQEDNNQFQNDDKKDQQLEKENRYFSNMQMISFKEEKTRKIVSGLIMLGVLGFTGVNGINYWVSHPNYLTGAIAQSSLAFLTGKDNQCGCILKNQWKVTGKTTDIPQTEQGKRLISLKKKGFLKNLGYSVLLSLAGSFAYQYAMGGTAAITNQIFLMNTGYVILGHLALTIALSFAA